MGASGIPLPGGGAGTESDPIASAALTTHEANVTDAHDLVTRLAAKVGTGDSRLTDARTPSDGSVTLAKLASGLLVPKSKLDALGIVNADVDAAAAIAESKLSLASDAAVGTASRRTLGRGAAQAMPGDTAALIVGRGAGRYAVSGSGTGTGVVRAIGDLFAVQLQLATARTLDRMAFDLTGGAASSLCRLGVYASSSGYPAAKLADAGTLATTGSGVQETAGGAISLAVTPGTVWLVGLIEGGAPTLRANSAFANPLLGFSSAANALGRTVNGLLLTGQTTGSLPDPFPASAADAQVPIIAVRLT